MLLLLTIVVWPFLNALKISMDSNSPSPNIFDFGNSVVASVPIQVPSSIGLTTSSNNEIPLFSFGVIGDPQYVDTENGSNFDGTKIRRYRQSLKILAEASDFFAAQSTSCNIVLGDCLDGKAGSLNMQDRCLQEVFKLTVHKDYEKWHFVLGNHEYYCFDRETILNTLVPASQRLNCSPTKLYYDFSPYSGYRFIVLDGYEISSIGGSNSDYRIYAEALLREKNHNYANGSNRWFLNMSSDNLRYCPYNGGISGSQFEWLRQCLQRSVISNEKCLVFCHEPIYVKCSHSNNLLWNSEEVLSLLQGCPNVIAYLAGHDHGGGFATDDCGIHHIIPPAPVECAEGEIAFGTFQLFPNRMELLWKGKSPSKTTWPSSVPLRI